MTTPTSKSKIQIGTGEIIIVDAYAWVEYALDGPHAEVINRWFTDADEVFTPASVIGEIKESMLRHNIESSKISLILAYIRSKSSIINIDADMAERAGEINFNYKKTIKGWGMLDSLVYASATAKDGKILTGDLHFKDLPNVVYIGE